MKVYLSGPMTGLPQSNYPAFDAAAASLRAIGYDVVNPADIGREIGDGLEWSQYMRPCIAALVQCDAVVMLPGWHESRGAMIERDIALALGMQVRWSCL